jgi:hypothetical protein
MMQKSSAHLNRAFVIIESDPIISMDLLGTVAAAFPQSSVYISELVADALSPSNLSLVPTSILINSVLVTEECIDVLRDCVDNGAKLVFIGSAPDTDLPSVVIELPFTTSMILNALS